MNTIISKIDIKNIDKNEIKKQAELIKEGKTVIFPTETVYGLGANALDENAVKKIYEAKGRPSDNPLIVHIYNKEEVYNLAKDVNEKAEIIMEHFWPGPITIILNKKDIVPYKTSGGLETVAIRMPSHSIAREIIKQAGVALKKRELIKGKIQNNSLEDAREAGEEIARKTNSELVCTIGSKFILYKRNKDKNQYGI